MNTRAAALTAALAFVVGCAAGTTDEAPGPPSAAAIEAARLDPLYRSHADRFRSLYSGGHHQEALKQARAALEAAPVLREPYVWVSRLSTLMGRNEEAIDFFAAVAQAHPELALPQFYKGFNEYNLSRFDDALVSFRRAAELDPTDAQAFYRQGIVMQLHADFDGALVALRRSRELDPGAEQTVAKLAAVLRIQGRHSDAQRLVAEGLEQHPDSAELRYASGLGLMHTRDDAAAEREFREALRLDPNLRVAHEHLARLLARAGREDEARYSRAVSNRLQDYRKTKRTLEARLQTARDGSFAMLLAEVELTRGSLDEALGWFRRAERMGGHRERIACGKAETLYRSGRVERADELLADCPRGGRQALAQAARAVASGETAAASRLLEAALANGPEERQFVRRVSDVYGLLGEDRRAAALLYEAASLRPLSSAPDR